MLAFLYHLRGTEMGWLSSDEPMRASDVADRMNRSPVWLRAWLERNADSAATGEVSAADVLLTLHALISQPVAIHHGADLSALILRMGSEEQEDMHVGHAF